MGWNQLAHPQAGADLPRPARKAGGLLRAFLLREAEAMRASSPPQTDYPTPFTSAIWHENVIATQFHPEKSQRVGLAMLRNFRGQVGEHGKPRDERSVSWRLTRSAVSDHHANLPRDRPARRPMCPPQARRLCPGDRLRRRSGRDGRRWVADGATYLHLVDLDGAKEGRAGQWRPASGPSSKASGVPCQLGGGLRTEDDIKQALGWGVARVIVGTKALQSPAWLTQMAQHLPGPDRAGHRRQRRARWRRRAGSTSPKPTALDLARSLRRNRRCRRSSTPTSAATA